jgi:hypothetical protein
MESRGESLAHEERHTRTCREMYALGYLHALSDVRHRLAGGSRVCAEREFVEAYAESDVPPSGLHALWAEHAYIPPAAGEVAA